MRTNSQGRYCVVRDTKTGTASHPLVAAIVVDAGVRLQSGEHFGEKRCRGEYELLEFVESRPEAAASIAMAWPD